MKTLYERLTTLEDKRKRRGIRYPLAAMLVMIIVAKLSGVDEVRAMAEWIKYRAASFRPLLALKHEKMPHATTISRVMNSAIDSDAQESVMTSYFKGQVSNDEALSIDGKTLCGTLKTAYIIRATFPSTKTIVGSAGLLLTALWPFSTISPLASFANLTFPLSLPLVVFLWQTFTSLFI